MSRSELQALFSEFVRIGAEARVEAGTVLWKEGDPGDHVVLLLDGTLEVVHEVPGGDVVVLRMMEPGGLVGEIASFDGRARSATVRARGACHVMRMPAQAFREMLRRRPDILEELFWLQVQRVRSLTGQVTRTHQRAITDPLTRLYNFGFFHERLTIELERARQIGDLVSLALFDIDHFKHYNDRNGHVEGNDVLVRVADILRGIGRRGDVVARYGGEEFVVLLYGATREEAVRFADSARRAIEAYPFRCRETQPLGRITLSGGVATFPDDALTDDGVIKVADLNLYRAKEAGRNRVLSVDVR